MSGTYQDRGDAIRNLIIDPIDSCSDYISCNLDAIALELLELTNDGWAYKEKYADDTSLEAENAFWAVIDAHSVEEV